MRSPDESNLAPYTPNAIRALFSNAPFKWWIAGGWSIDLFIGKQTRPHFDMDIAIARHDQILARQYLKTWDFHYPMRDQNENIVLHPWKTDMILGFDIPSAWAREKSDAPWRFEFLLQEIDDTILTFRYCDLVLHSVKDIEECAADGVYYLLPEFTLLTKAARMRDIDEQDFQKVLPYLSTPQKAQLARDLSICWKDHKWLALL